MALLWSVEAVLVRRGWVLSCWLRGSLLFRVVVHLMWVRSLVVDVVDVCTSLFVGPGMCRGTIWHCVCRGPCGALTILCFVAALVELSRCCVCCGPCGALAILFYFVLLWIFPTSFCFFLLCSTCVSVFIFNLKFYMFC
jgi:hypothetical protein